MGDGPSRSPRGPSIVRQGPPFPQPKSGNRSVGRSENARCRPAWAAAPGTGRALGAPSPKVPQPAQRGQPLPPAGPPRQAGSPHRREWRVGDWEEITSTRRTRRRCRGRAAAARGPCGRRRSPCSAFTHFRIGARPACRPASRRRTSRDPGRTPSRVCLTTGARSSAVHFPGSADATMPETLHDHVLALRQLGDVLLPLRASFFTSALPQWSRMKRVSGQASISFAASGSSAGRMHRSKLKPCSPSKLHAADERLLAGNSPPACPARAAPGERP